jgi:putative hemolysin
LEDLVEELVGDIRDEYDQEDGAASTRDGEALEVDGLTNLDDFEEDTGITLPEGPYETVAGFLVAEVGELPALGTSLVAAGHRYTVVALDGRRIARIRVEPLPTGQEEPADAADDPEPAQGGAAGMGG